MCRKHFITAITAGALLLLILAVLLISFYRGQSLKAEIGFPGQKQFMTVTDKEVLRELKRCEDETLSPSRFRGRAVYSRRLLVSSSGLEKEFFYDDGKLIDQKRGLIFPLKPRTSSI